MQRGYEKQFLGTFHCPRKGGSIVQVALHNLTHLIRFTSAMGQAIQDGCFSEDFAPWEEDSPAHHTW